MAHWRSWSGLSLPRTGAVTRPRTLQEALDAVAAASAEGRRVRAMGAGTSCAPMAAGSRTSGSPMDAGGIDLVLDTSGLVGVAADADGGATALAGTSAAELVSAVAAMGRALPAVVPFGPATVGGMLATGSHGSDGVLAVASVEAAPVVTDDGRTGVRNGPATGETAWSGGGRELLLAARLRLVEPYSLRVRQSVVDFEEALAVLAADPSASVHWLPSAPVATLRRSERAPYAGTGADAPPPARSLRSLRAALRTTPVLGVRIIERAARRQPSGEGREPWFADAARTQPRAVWAEWLLPRALLLPALRGLRSALLDSPELSALPVVLRTVPAADGTRLLSVGVRAPSPGPFARYFAQAEAAMSTAGAWPSATSWTASHTTAPSPTTTTASPGAATPEPGDPLRH